MIDISSVLNFTKDFPKETGLTKNLVAITNDCKNYLSHFKTGFDSEVKEIEVPMRQLLQLCKSFNSEVILSNLVNEDMTNFLNTLQYYLILQEDTATTYLEDFISVNSSFNNEYSRQVFCPALIDIVPIMKDYSGLRNKQKGYNLKIEKAMRELVLSVQERKKESEKLNYNTIEKGKLDEKIIKYVGDYYESLSQYQSNIEIIQNTEKQLNDQLISMTEGTIKYLYQFFLKLRSFFSIILEGKLLVFCKLINNISDNLELIAKLKIENPEGIFKNFANSKQLKIPELNQISLELQYTKVNFLNSQLFETLISHLSFVSQIQSSKRKTLNLFLRYVKDRLKVTEAFISNWSKMVLKHFSSAPKLNFQHILIQQMSDIFRAVNDVIGKKLNEYYKSFNIMVGILEQQIKDLNTEESNCSDLRQKLQKDYSGFKEQIMKYLNSFEKVESSINAIKSEINSGCDDPNNFSKYESKLHCLRIEENELKEEKEQLHKKTLKYLEEHLALVISICSKCYKSLSEKSIEIKESLINYEKTNLKNFVDIKSYFDVYKNQFSTLIIEDEIKKIFLSKEFIDKAYLDSINPTNEESFGKFSEKVFSLMFLDVKRYDRKRLSEVMHSSAMDLENLSEQSNTKRMNSSPQELNKPLDEVSINLIEDLFKPKTFPLSDDILTKEEFNDYLELYKKKDEKQDLKKHEGLFYVEANEQVYESFSCGLSDTILLQGKIYVTSRKVVFSSWFNGSTLFGKTLIEIPLGDMTNISKRKNLLFDNSILVQTKLSDFYFTSFVNRGDCFRTIVAALEAIGNFKKEPDSETGPKPEEVSAPRRSKSEPQSKKGSFDETAIMSPRQKISSIVKPCSIDFSGNANNDERFEPSCEILNTIGECHNNQEEISFVVDEDGTEEPEISKPKTALEIFEESKIRQKLQEVTKIGLDAFYKANPRISNETFVVDYKISDLPLSYIYDCIYNPERITKTLGFDNNYMHSFKLSVNDTDIKCTYNKDEFKIPEIFRVEGSFGPFESIFNPESPEVASVQKMCADLDELLQIDNNTSKFISPNSIVVFNSNHPIPNPKFMGPKKLDVKEEIKVYFISPTCFIADHYTNLSGFMMMDTFFIITSYKYESILTDNLKFDTRVTVDFTLEFTKACYFKDKVSKESLIDNREYLKKEILVKMKRAIESRNEEYKQRLENYKNSISRSHSSQKKSKNSKLRSAIKVNKASPIKELDFNELLPQESVIMNQPEGTSTLQMFEETTKINSFDSIKEPEISIERALSSNKTVVNINENFSTTNLLQLVISAAILLMLWSILDNQTFSQLNGTINTLLMIILYLKLNN